MNQQLLNAEWGSSLFLGVFCFLSDFTITRFYQLWSWASLRQAGGEWTPAEPYDYVIGLCVLHICRMQCGLSLFKQELRLRLVLTRFSLWRLLQNQTLTTSFSRWRPLAIRAISWEEGLLFSIKLCSRASLAPRLQLGTREREEKMNLKVIVWYALYHCSL